MSTTTWGNPDGTPLPMLGPTPAEKQARKAKLLSVIAGENPPADAVKLATERWPNYDTDPDHGRAVMIYVQGWKAAAAVSLTEREAGDKVIALFQAAWEMSVEQQAGPEGWSMAKRWAFDKLAAALEPFRTEYGDELDLSKINLGGAASPTRKGSSEPDGAELIAAERQEQIHKHGWDVKRDQDYGRGELVQAAATCLSLYVTGDMASINVAGQYNQRKMWPWQSEFGMTYYAKIWAKSDVDKLKVAGALIAAEIDRLQAPPQP